jgi:hypothetical protein
MKIEVEEMVNGGSRQEWCICGILEYNHWGGSNLLFYPVEKNRNLTVSGFSLLY